MAHARLSPSNHRWPKCPGSIKAENAYADFSSDAAIDGTGSHLLLETCIETRRPDVKAIEFLGRTIGVGHPDKPEGWLIEADRCKRVQVALDYLVLREEEIGGVTTETESLSDVGQYFGRTDWWGTVDITLRSIEPRYLEVIDYKDGYTYVDVNDNSQLIAYMGGKLAPFLFPNGVPITFDACPVKTVRMTIIQPKIESNPIRHITMTPAELWQKVDKLNDAATQTDSPDAYLCAGEHCKWCKHKPSCPEHASQAMEGLEMMMDDSSVETGSETLIEVIKSREVSVENMETEQLSKILDAEPTINAMLNNVREEMIKRLNEGKPGHGYTLGSGRKSKAWKDDEEMIVKKLKGMKFKQDDLYPKKLISPAQALKKEGLTERQQSRIIDELVEIKLGNPVLKKSNLKKLTPEEMFSDVKLIGATAPTTATETAETVSFI